MTHWLRTSCRRPARLALGVAFSLATVSAAAAAEYHLVAMSDDYISLVDKSSIYQTGGYSRGWVVTINQDVTDDQANAAFASALVEVDCQQHKTRAVTFTSRDEDGELLDSVDNDDQSWSNTEPGTNGEDIEKAICSPETMNNPMPSDNLPDLREAYLKSQQK